MNASDSRTPSDLSALSLYALVAFASRCARRAYLRLLQTKEAPDGPYRAAVEAALAAAERAAGGLPFESHALCRAGERALEAAAPAGPVAGTVARAAALAVDTAYQAFVERIYVGDGEAGRTFDAEHAREVAARAEATRTVAAEVGGITDEPLHDLRKLLDLQAGADHGDGVPIADLSEGGPLGSFWPLSEPGPGPTPLPACGEGSPSPDRADTSSFSADLSGV